MGSRLELQTLLETVLGSDKVYFQPPPSIIMSYPCIVYNRSKIDTKFANNNPYNLEKEYSITVIDKNPDSLIPEKIANLPRCIFNRHFTSDNINHDVFILYF